ncbi:MaoC family dehydratase [Marinobacterium sp. D7]|uniref:MaoC family dehydratase n=1 Tax=Marinobacterium ramblicola TaxID=2849041 RepID=UPI001C2DCEBE|nr:MaoC family dehydratase [Marinobacterium ramblicola]MBV1790424.1 MaoC family dehydratase [Marinobacterium ramblicola]
MDVIEYIKEKERSLRSRINGLDLKGNPDGHLRQLTYFISHSLNNTLNNSWVSRIKLFSEAEEEQDLQGVKNPKVIAFYRDWHGRIGKEVFVGDWMMVDQTRIDHFAEVTGDQQWIHTDPERAKNESPFGDTIAHGFLVLSLLPHLTDTVNPEKPPYPEARMVVNCGLDQVRFPHPVKSGSRIRARTTLKSLTPAKRSVEMVNRIEVEAEGSSRFVCVADSLLRLYF